MKLDLTGRLTLLLTTMALVLGTSAMASASDVLPLPPGTALPTQAALDDRVGFLAVTVAFSNAPGSTTPPRTPDITALQLARDIRELLNPWLTLVSQGVYTGEAVSTYDPIVTVTTSKPICSDSWAYEVDGQVTAALRAQGFEPDDYKAVFFYYSKMLECRFAGYAIGNRVWLDGVSDRRVLIHEFGHTLGLDHANSMTCKTATGEPVTLSDFIGGSCAMREYGDIYSAMGEFDPMTFASAILERLGWNTGRVERISSTTPTVTKFLTPLEDDIPGSTEALRISDGANLWLEYRTPTGVDGAADLDPRSKGGLLMRMELTGVQAPVLLTLRPDTSLTQFEHPEFRVGQTWVNPRGHLSFTLNSASPLGASVTITQRAVPVPNLNRLIPNAARTAITTAGFIVGTTTSVTTCENAGKVISQVPAAGTLTLPGRLVNFTFAVPPASGCSGPQQ